MRSPQATYFAQQSIELVNQERGRARLPPLTAHAPLSKVAQAHSEAMAGRGFYGHIDPEGRDVAARLAAVGYPVLASAENIARGQASPVDVVAGWMASPGHRANILNANLRLIGAGYAFADTPPYDHYWTHVFATPDLSVGRDTSGYPAEVVTAINRARRAAGKPLLVMADDLAGIAGEQAGLLAATGADRFRTQAPPVMRAAAQTARTCYDQAVVMVAGGYPTPAEVAAYWLQGDAAARLLDATLRAVGVGYHYAAGDKARHYWVAILAG
jgi:uncharacterized protein YkwD